MSVSLRSRISPAPALARSPRLRGVQLPQALRRGAILVDIRSQAQRSRQGALPGALAIEADLLVSRCDPAGSARLRLATDHAVAWVVICADGGDSPRAAAALRALGLHRATDLIGGYRGLRAAGLLDVATGQPHFVRELVGLAGV
ncbi:rhodanese-like domain-containing protein [Skermania piniformis]|uniref:Sulfurtransferase n=1 Tax=Skermania pinensis TaxID=39122 RepID=A0ABX8S763_9ACTN|nr:rhodanese-like domain-containing protein [Skermania piniformis]QXQ13634.1 sulfurtransferase [Skermania piniformis]